MNESLRRLVVSSLDGQGLEADVSPHFGRCPTFTVVHVEDGAIRDHEVVTNPYADHHRPGQVPAFLAELGAVAVLAGGMGRRAIEIFDANGIEPSVGHAGTVRDAVMSYLRYGMRTGEGCSGHQHPDGCAGHGA